MQRQGKQEQGHCLVCKERMRKAKVCLKMNLASDEKNIKKGFYMYVNQKRLKKVYPL